MFFFFIELGSVGIVDNLIFGRGFRIWDLLCFLMFLEKMVEWVYNLRVESRVRGEWGKEVYILFVDNIRKEVILRKMKDLFEEYEGIIDVYILRKEKKVYEFVFWVYKIFKIRGC